MKQFLAISLLCLFTNQSFAAQVIAARMDPTQTNLLIDVVYSGGCGKHEFSLKIDRCLESYPVQCTAQLVHKTKDFCELLVKKTVSISLKENGLTDSYFERARLTILGAKDWQTNDYSKATVQLP